MRRVFLLVSALSAGVLMPSVVLAHCPLCTAGAGIVALGAYWVGVNGVTVGVWIGAFAVALGLWIARLIKKKYVPYQDAILAVFSWLTTLLPLQMLFSEYASIYIHWSGEYGSLLNRTYPINLFLIGGVIGGIIVSLAPSVSRALTKRKGATIPYQGIAVTFALLILTSLITQFVL